MALPSAFTGKGWRQKGTAALEGVPWLGEGEQSILSDPGRNKALSAGGEGNLLHPVAGQVQGEGQPLNPEQQFEQERALQDPFSTDTLIANPYKQGTDDRTQRAGAAYRTNADLARKAYGMTPGEDAYTVNPEMYQTMGWSPDEKYAYEDDIAQKRGATTGLDAQTEALGGYRDIVNEQGLTAIDRARIAQSHQGQEQELRANREAIMQNAQEQGRAGGQAQLLAQMQASQGTANMRAMNDLQTNALGLQRKDAAIGSMGDLGGTIQTAQDSIDRFNTEGKRLRQERNVERRNQGVDVRYQDEQTAGRANVDTKNAAEQLNKSAGYGARGRYGDQVGAIEGIQQANANQAEFEQGRQANIVQQRQQRVDNVMGGVGAVTNVAGQAANYLLPKKKAAA